MKSARASAAAQMLMAVAAKYDAGVAFHGVAFAARWQRRNSDFATRVLVAAVAADQRRNSAFENARSNKPRGVAMANSTCRRLNWFEPRGPPRAR